MTAHHLRQLVHEAQAGNVVQRSGLRRGGVIAEHDHGEPVADQVQVLHIAAK